MSDAESRALLERELDLLDERADRMLTFIDLSSPDWRARTLTLTDRLIGGGDEEEGTGSVAYKIAAIMTLMRAGEVAAQRTEKTLANWFKLVLAGEIVHIIMVSGSSSERPEEEVETRSRNLGTSTNNRDDDEESDEVRNGTRTRLRSLTNDKSELELVADKKERVWPRIIQTLFGFIQDWIRKTWRVNTTWRKRR